MTSDSEAYRSYIGQFQFGGNDIDYRVELSISPQPHSFESDSTDASDHVTEGISRPWRLADRKNMQIDRENIPALSSALLYVRPVSQLHHLAVLVTGREFERHIVHPMQI